jgi:hypothetical protein
MSNDQPPAERQLVAALAVAVSLFLPAALPDDVDERGFISHLFQGPFDEICSILWELGVAVPDAGGSFHDYHQQAAQDAIGPGAFKFLPPDEMRATISQHAELSAALTHRLLEAFLRAMGDYSWHGAQLDTGRAPFIPPAIFHPQIDALVACGYLRRAGEAVAWTDQISEAMQAAGHWDDTNAPPPPVVVTLPADIRRRVDDLLRDGQRLAAIAVVRRAADVPLTAAVAFVESIERL